jgi:glycerol-1-phosphatase
VSEVTPVSWRECSTSPGAEYDVLLLDLDGVVYVGLQAVPAAVVNLNRATDTGLRSAYVTNNASRPPQVVAQHLRDLGLSAADDQVVTSAQEGAELLAGSLPSGARVLAVGGPGVAAALEEVGLAPTTRWDDTVTGVLQGFGTDVGWRDLAEASYAVAGGATWVATNPDLTVPTPRGTAPGNGQLTAVVQRTTGVEPQVTGKPGKGLFELAVRRCGGHRPLVVGDRLDTDIAGAVNAGFDSLLVLTGVTDVVALLTARPGERPSYLARDLAGLWSPQPGVQADDGWWVCAGTRVRLEDGHLEVAALVSEQVDRAMNGAGDADLSLLRAAASAVWEAQDAGADVDVLATVDLISGHAG